MGTARGASAAHDTAEGHGGSSVAPEGLGGETNETNQYREMRGPSESF